MKKKLLKIFSFAILLIGLYNVKSYAAISASSKTVKSGENVSISITSNEAVTSYKVTMTDAGGLTFKNSTGGTGAGTATITDAKETGMKSLATYTFSTPNVTKDTTYKVKFFAEAMEKIENGEYVNVPDSSATATITVKAPANSGNDSNSGNAGASTSNGNSSSGSTDTSNNDSNKEQEKSKNADLSNLGIKPNDFSGFKPAITSYDVTVPNDVDSVTVYATKKDSKAKVSGIGYKELTVGKNTVKVVVTAEAGNTKTYTLNIIREGEETVVPNTGETDGDEEENKEIRLSNLVLDDKLNLKLSPNFDPEVFEYEVDLGEEYKDLEELELTAISNIENAKIEIKGNTELKDGENIITIVVTNPENNENVTYKIKVTKTAQEVVTDEAQQYANQTQELVGAIDDEFEKEEQKRENAKIWTIRAIIILLIIGLIVLLIYKYRESQDEEEMLFNEENDSDEDNFINSLNYENPDIVKMQEDMQNENNEIEENQEELKEQFLNGFEKSEEQIEEPLRAKRKAKHSGKHF